MEMDFIKLTLMTCLLMFSTSATAFDVVAETGFHSGGDTLATAASTSSGTETLQAGDGYSFAAGIGMSMGQKAELIFTLGIKKETIYPDAGTISFVRYPVNLLLMIKSGFWRYGLGLTAHMNPLYKEEIGTTKQSIDFKDASGYLLDVRYVIFDDVFVAGRYTKIEYEIQNDPTTTAYDGSSIGLLVGIQF